MSHLDYPLKCDINMENVDNYADFEQEMKNLDIPLDCDLSEYMVSIVNSCCIFIDCLFQQRVRNSSTQFCLWR